MKKLTLILSLMFIVTLSSPSYAKWEKVTQNSVFTTYVDFERIRKVDGYVYYWQMFDYPKINELGNHSVQRYDQGDCKLFRHKSLSVSRHKEVMGGGAGIITNLKNLEWFYPTPNSVDETVLKKVCALAK